MVKLKQCFAVLGIGLAASASAASIAKGNDKDLASVDAVDPELTKRSQELRIKASETGRCNPSPENKNYCNRLGYCDLFDTKDLPRGSCIPLDGTEESKKLESVLHKEPDGTYVFIDSVEPQEAPVSTNRLGADSDNGQKVKPLLNAEENFRAEASGAGAEDEKGSVAGVLAHFRNKDELKPFAAAQAQSQMKSYFAQFGHCAEESSTCHQHSCLLDSLDCTAYSPEEKKEIIELTQQLLMELISTVKCHPVPENASCCNKHGYCDLFAVKHLPEGSCRFLKTAEYVDVLSMMRPGPDGSFRFIKDDPDVHKGAGVERLERRSFNSASDPEEFPSEDNMKRELSSSAYKGAGSDPEFVTYYPSSSDSISRFAQPSKHETHAFMELSWEIAGDDLISVTIALAAGISDVKGLEQFYDRLNVFAVHKHAAMQALTRAKEAQMMSESKGTGEIVDTEDDAGSSESLVQAAEPTEREVRTLMDICSRLTQDDVKLQAISMAADIHEMEDLYKFRVRISTMGTRVQAAKRALTRVKALQSVFESTGADEASTASSIKAKRDLPVKVVKDADGTVISDE
ncbi:hypothetical protein NDA16_002273 [Ustilago loliicola]|nr:hypothetical protein NDA16_002273 [Ustilago loliicola]